MRKPILFGLIFLLSISAVIAQYQDAYQFYGSVTINGHPADDGLLVTAKVGGNDVKATSTLNGKYGESPTFTILDTFNDLQGQTVNFYVLNFDTRESSVLDGLPQAKNLDLSLNGDLFCGDNLCGSSESCSSCLKDCGACAPNPSTGSSGGPGGGGGGSGGAALKTTQSAQTEQSSGCTPDWVCSGWLPCMSASQQRVCVDGNKCNDDSARPEETRSCDIPKSKDKSAGQVIDANNAPGGTSALDKIKSFFGITGAVGASDSEPSPSSMFLTGTLALIAVALLLFVFRKRIFKQKKI